MNELIINIENSLQNVKTEVKLENASLNTIIKCYSDFCSKDIVDFSEAFNSLFKNQTNSKNFIEVLIGENDSLFEKALDMLNNDDYLIKTDRINNFNNATITTSLAKCTKDKNIYILRCYDYFIYIFNKKQKKCYILVKNNKKAITMINVLLLTPYLMYAELFAVHGGLVNNGNNNILINNSSLGGKTTFAILFATHDWNIITEETTYITSEGVILPYNIRNYFNIRAGTYIAFKDFFYKKNIINNDFIALKDKDTNELFDYGKKLQFSIDFDKLGTKKSINTMRITHSLKVSIEKNQQFKIEKCSSLENVNSFLELSLAPTVLLFKELLDFYAIDKKKREERLNDIFKNTKSFVLKSGFDYKRNFNSIIKTLDI